MGETGERLIEVRGLRFAYRSEQVLRGVEFTVESGDLVSVIGSNGAGKSTLLRILLGELAPDSGEVLLMGQPVARFQDWPQIGYVPQGGGGLAEGFPATVDEVVGMGLYAAFGPLGGGKERRRRILEALKAVEMDTHAGERIGRLSGGQVQRVLIARALAGKSRLLLMDEPTAGVDAGATEALYELLREMNRARGLSVVMVTHDIAGATPYVTRTLCLEHGTVVELDKAQIAHEMAHRHHHP